MKKISIVTSLYKSAPYVADFYTRHLACLKQLDVDYEFVFVDDGSPDDSAQRVREIVKKDANVRLVVFSRNYGQYPAMFAGMAEAKGDYIFTSDSDLEEDPENLIEFYKKATTEDIDFLYAVVKKRDGGIIRNTFGKLFYMLMQYSANINIPENMSWQILMNRNYVRGLLLYKESETLPAGLMMLTGFKQDHILIDKSYKGSTSYTFRKRLTLAFNSITAFSSKPLLIIGLFGIFITILSFIFVIVAVVMRYYIDYQIGWISIILSIWLVGGFMLSSIGVVGIYLAKIFNQVKNRPLYIIREIVEQK
jgi:putative glycosyltransferase